MRIGAVKAFLGLLNAAMLAMTNAAAFHLGSFCNAEQ